MKVLLYFLLIFGFIPSLKSQDRFFEFLPGWRNLKIIENENRYYSVGTTSDGIGLNHYQFSSFSKIGDGIEPWEFDLDTASNLVNTFTNDIGCTEYNCLITGTIKGMQSNRFYGTMIKFTSDFTDTLKFTTFNILPGNGTMIRTHLNINPNKFILGGFLQDTDFQVYPSLMQSDSLGNIQWRSDFYCGSNCDLYPNHIMQAADGGYFFTCAELHNSGGSDIGFAKKTAIIKTDSLGNEQFRLQPGNPDLYTVNGWVLATDDGNFITAYSDPMKTFPDELPEVNPESTIWILKIDIEGNTIFEKSLIDFLPLVPGFDVGYPFTITQMIYSIDGNIIIVGYTGIEGFILKATQQGEGIWFRLITPLQAEGNNAGLEFTKIRGITPTSDGGYIMAGEYFSSPGNIFPEGIQTAFAAKVDEFGCLEPGCQIGDGVAEIKKVDLGLQIFPNPASGVVNVVVAENVRVAKVRVYEVTGRMVLKPFPSTGSGQASQGDIASNKLQLNIIDLSPGMYLIEVETKDGFREVKRLVVE